MHVTNWDADAVSVWLSQLGLQSVEQKFRDNDITGDVLIHADDEMLSELDITSVGVRILLLKGIYWLKREHGIAVLDGEYVPETVTATQEKGMCPEVREAFLERDQALGKLSRDIKRIVAEVQQLREQVGPVIGISREFKRQGGMRRGGTRETGRRPKSPRSVRVVPPAEHKTKKTATRSPTTTSATLASPTIDLYHHRQAVTSSREPSPSSSSEDSPFKSCRISFSDPCSKVLQLALSQYSIQGSWHRYALFITSRSQNGGCKERILGWDERPLDVFMKMKEGGDDPLLVLKRRDDDSDDGGAKAVAVYEYRRKREDEASLTIGDQVTILERVPGWLHILNPSFGSGFVPAGCLLEEKIAQLEQPMPESSYPLAGTVLYDFEKVGPNEISVRKGERVWVKRLYRHWLVGEVERPNAAEGWMPSCYVEIEVLKDTTGTTTRGNEWGTERPAKGIETADAARASSTPPPSPSPPPPLPLPPPPTTSGETQVAQRASLRHSISLPNITGRWRKYRCAQLIPRPNPHWWPVLSSWWPLARQSPPPPRIPPSLFRCHAPLQPQQAEKPPMATAPSLPRLSFGSPFRKSLLRLNSGSWSTQSSSSSLTSSSPPREAEQQVFTTRHPMALPTENPSLTQRSLSVPLLHSAAQSPHHHPTPLKPIIRADRKHMVAWRRNIVRPWA